MCRARSKTRRPRARVKERADTFPPSPQVHGLVDEGPLLRRTFPPSPGVHGLVDEGPFLRRRRKGRSANGLEVDVVVVPPSVTEEGRSRARPCRREGGGEAVSSRGENRKRTHAEPASRSPLKQQDEGEVSPSSQPAARSSTTPSLAVGLAVAFACGRVMGLRRRRNVVWTPTTASNAAEPGGVAGAEPPQRGGWRRPRSGLRPGGMSEGLPPSGAVQRRPQSGLRMCSRSSSTTA